MEGNHAKPQPAKPDTCQIQMESWLEPTCTVVWCGCGQQHEGCSMKHADYSRKEQCTQTLRQWTAIFMCLKEITTFWLTKHQNFCSDNTWWQECWMLLSEWIKQLPWDCSKRYRLLKSDQICWFNVLWTYNVTTSTEFKVCVSERNVVSRKMYRSLRLTLL